MMKNHQSKMDRILDNMDISRKQDSQKGERNDITQSQDGSNHQDDMHKEVETLREDEQKWKDDNLGYQDKLKRGYLNTDNKALQKEKNA